MANFKLSLENGWLEHDNSNFGMAPNPRVEMANLDSVVFVSDSIAVMFTSKYCGREYDFYDTGYIGEFWKAGADTVRNHPLFSMQHELDSIKRSLRRSYYFRNNTDKVKFIGYDNDKPTGQNLQQQQDRQKRELFPVSAGEGGDGPGPLTDNTLPMLLILLLASVAAGFFSWKFIKP